MKKLLIMALSMTFVVSLSACNGDVEEDETEHSQGVTEDTIYVGNTAVTSGNAGFVGQPFVAAMEAYFENVNEDGGVLGGREIEYIHRDDGFNPDEGYSNTQKLVEEDEVFALVGHFGTPTVSATEDYLNQQGILRVYYGTGSTTVRNENAELDDERTSFPVQPVYETEGRMMVRRAIDTLEAENIGLLYTVSDDVGREIQTGMLAEADQHSDVNIISQQVAGGDFSTAAQLLVDRDDLDAIVVGSSQFEATPAILALSDQGNELPVLTSYVCANQTVADQVSSVFDSFDVYANAWLETVDEDGDFSDPYQDYIDTMEGVEDGAYVSNTFGIAGWVAAMVFVEGLERMDEDEPITWLNYADAMEEDIFTYDFGNPIDYTDGKRLGTQTMALLQMGIEDEEPYLEVVEEMEHIDEVLD